MEINDFQYLRIMRLKSISDCDINIFGHCRAKIIFGLVYLEETWTFGNLDNLGFEQLGLWITWALSNLDFEQFGQLGHSTAWVTWTLDHLGNLDFGKFANSNFLETYVLKNFNG